jgi:hypothetical protein
LASRSAVFALEMVIGLEWHQDVFAGSTLSPKQTTPHLMTCAVLVLYKASSQGRTGGHIYVGEWITQLEDDATREGDCAWRAFPWLRRTDGRCQSDHVNVE